MVIMEKVRDVDTPDVKIEMPKVDMDKAKANVSRATSSMRDAVYNRLPQREAPSRIPYIVGGLLAGMSIGYFVATSDWFGPMVKDTLDQWRERFTGMRSQSGHDELGANGAITYTEMTAVMADATPTDPLSDTDPDAARRRSEQSYAI